MTVNYAKAPFPWPGGKSRAAPAVWAALGDVAHYVEPFFGSGAVLIGRPHPANRAYFSETVNDADGLLVNVWRAIQHHPDETAGHASWPVTEADIHARHCALIAWRAERQLEHLMGDPEWCDPRMAGWWLHGIGAWIGSGWCDWPSGNGPWWPDETGRLTKRPRQGTGDEPGVPRKRPYLSNNGRGVHRPQLREPGVKRQRPHLSDNGQGVHHAGLREPGVWRKRPHLSNNGQGVHHAGLREPGDEHHELTMPELREWFRRLSARLRHVRIVNGDWTRVTSRAATNTIACNTDTPAGVFLDPPYASTAGRAELYAHDDFEVAHQAAEWAIGAANPTLRIVFAGYDGEHGRRFTDNGWTEVEWFTDGYLTGGYGNQNTERGHQQARERLWLSPHCIHPDADTQLDLFGGTP